MAKRSVAEKAETHEKILRHASQAFRAQGSGVGIGEVMKELGLTHGGFYRHFESKDELLIEAITLSLNEIAERLERVAQKAEEGKRLESIITAYLSSEHLLHPEVWCALATLAPDMGRQSAGVRKRLDGALQAYMEKMSKYMPGKNEQERRDTFLVLFSGMAGAMAMTRAVGDKTMREHILNLTRKYYLETFAKSSVPA
jgi:TetR/AcrR family transcriptional regulator, transcriptional repressor for nem operon